LPPTPALSHAEYMAADPARKRDDELMAAFEAVPPEMVAEILDGELHTMHRPSATHARASSELGIEIGAPFGRGRGGPGGWVILDDPELRFGIRPDIIVPDLAGWRRERMPEIPDVAAFTLAPDWVCEVLSERTEKIDRGKKMRIYRRESVGFVWLVNPVLQTVEVYRLENARWVWLDTFEGNEKVRAEPFDAIELDLSVLWAR
jgi:Uma2 family endonuclease